MKITKLILSFFAVLIIAFTAVFKDAALAMVEAIVFGCLVVDMRTALSECRLGTPTLITNILTGKIIKPLRTMVPEIGYFSTDFGKTGSEFAPPVKFGQEVISHLIDAPTAEDWTPGTGLGSNSQNPKDLLTDCKVKIDKAAKVTIKLPVTDSIRYLLSDAFSETMNQATISLGRHVLGKVTAKFNQGCFSQEYLITKAANEFAKLNRLRGAMNKLGTLTPRFVLGETDWCAALPEDPVISNGQYYGQQIGSDPYLTLVNIAGFNQVREYPNMPTNNVVIGATTITNAGDVFTKNAHGLIDGQRIRLSNIVTSTGVSTNTDYYVISAAANTFQVSEEPGGTAVVIGTGDGTCTVTLFEALNALAFERRAIHVAFRELLDNSELARQLGIPETSRKIKARDEETGLPVTWHLWEDATGTNPTGDIYATGVVAYGVVAGREIIDPTSPAEQEAGAGMDYGAVRIVETATTLAA